MYIYIYILHVFYAYIAYINICYVHNIVIVCNIYICVIIRDNVTYERLHVLDYLCIYMINEGKKCIISSQIEVLFCIFANFILFFLCL